MTTNAPESDRLLSVEEAAAKFGVHPVTVRLMLEECRLPKIQPGGPGHAVRISERDLLQPSEVER
jgi:excisionase family DNA binding protein